MELNLLSIFNTILKEEEEKKSTEKEKNKEEDNIIKKTVQINNAIKKSKVIRKVDLMPTINLDPENDSDRSLFSKKLSRGYGHSLTEDECNKLISRIATIK